MLRIVHGPTNFGNQAWILSRQERQLGVDSRVVVNVPPPNDYSADRVLDPSGKHSPWGVARRVAFGLSAPWRYDVLHYYYGRSYLACDGIAPLAPWQFADLKLAHRLGRKVYMTLQGCDVRLAGRSDAQDAVTACRAGYCSQFEHCRSVVDRRRQRLIDDILPRCDRIFALNPEFCRYIDRATFLPYTNVDVHAVRPAPPALSGPIHLVHAPTDPAIKGTRYVEQAAARLSEKYPIRFTLVQGLSHLDAWRVYRTADLVIDQLLVGWYGGLAVEAMSLGKPVMSYIRAADLRHVPQAMRDELPIESVTPETLEAQLEAAIQARSTWHEWSERSRRFVLRWHDPRTIAAQMIASYEDRASRFELRPAEIEGAVCAA